MLDFFKTYRLKILAALGLCFIGIGYIQSNPSIKGLGTGILVVIVILTARGLFIKKGEPTSESN